MKHFIVLITALVLVACGGGPQQKLPPELMGTGNNRALAVTSNPLGELPVDPSNQVIEEETTAIQPNTETETGDEIENPVSLSGATAANCEALTTDLETSFADMNFCETNDDCQVARGSCPFGCYLFHNAALDFADYQGALDAYQANCNPCEYQCAQAPRAADRRCVEGRCVDARNQN